MKVPAAIVSFAAILLPLPSSLAETEAGPPVLRREAASGDFHLPSTGVSSRGNVLLLGIDNVLLPIRENVSLYLAKPTLRAEPVLAPSRDDPKAPDQAAAHFYGAVLHDNGKFRMWYYACGFKEPGDPYKPAFEKLTTGPVCYAESDDGITWTKPKLGQVEFSGSKANNAIFLPDSTIEGVNVIRDDDDPDPERRYKMVYNPHNGKTWVIRTATSPDGYKWKAAETFAIDQFLETASFYRFNGMYVTHGQRSTPGEHGHESGRQGRAILSANFDTWLPGDAEAFHLVEPVNPADRGLTKPYDQVHLGVGAASFGNVVVGLYGLWHNQAGNNREQEMWGWFGYGKISCDFGLLLSNDGLTFREPVKGHVFISATDTPASSAHAKKYPTILTQSGSGILNVGDETRIYFGRWLNAAYGMEYTADIALATLPRDRWGGLGLYPKSSTHYRSHGSVWSAPVRLPHSGCEVFLNADRSDAMTVEVADADFHFLPEYSGDRAGKTAQANGLDCKTGWSGGSLAKLAGRTVRFKVNMKAGAGVDPRLYAVTLRPISR